MTLAESVRAALGTTSLAFMRRARGLVQRRAQQRGPVVLSGDHLEPSGYAGAVNAALRALPPPTFDLEELKATAQRKERAELVDPLPFADTFAVAAEELASHAELSPLGRVWGRATLLKMLRNQIRIQRYARELPDVRAIPVVRPIFIVGGSRTGTTMLHQVMAAVLDVRAPRFYELIEPVPAPGAHAQRARLQETERALHFGAMLSPDLDKLHHYEVDAPEECFMLLRNALACPNLDASFRLPVYAAHLRSFTRERWVVAYEAHKLQIQILSRVRRSGERDAAKDSRCWLFKAPAHMRALDAILAVYPDAVLVQTHRDLEKALGSYFRLMTQFHAPTFEGGASFRRVGRHLLRFQADRYDENVRCRRALPHDAILDVPYRELIRDLPGVIRTICARAGMSPPADLDERVARWLADNPEGKHGRVEGSLRTFGVTREDIAAHFRAYLEMFGDALAHA